MEMFAHQFALRNAEGPSKPLTQIEVLECQTQAERETQLERVELQTQKERPRHKGEVMCQLAASLVSADRPQEGAKQYERARDVGAAHGLARVESTACQALGQQAMQAGRHEEGVKLLRDGLAAAQLAEKESNYKWNIPALYTLIDALFESNAIQDVETLFQRMAEVCPLDMPLKGREGGRDRAERGGESEWCVCDRESE